MIKNYFKIAWRNITRNRVYTIINIVGLSIGICACTVIYLVAGYEFGFDNFHPDKERIHRIIANVTENTGDKLHFGRIPMAVSQNGRAELSGFDAIAGVIPYYAKISIPGRDNAVKHFTGKVEGINFLSTVIAEPQYFDIFKYEWLAGNPATALSAPYQVVLSENKARQYFGNELPGDIIGRQVIYNDSLKVAVSGIIKDWDKNSDLAFTDFISYRTIQSSFLINNFNPGSWSERDMPMWTFVKLSKGMGRAQFDAQINKLVKRHTSAQINLALWLEPLSNLHFNAAIIENPIRTADKPTLYSLIGIALFILILAVINFINLSTAQSIRRAKEVGVRKVLGSNRRSLIVRFLTETFSMTVFSVLLSMFLVQPVLEVFHSFIPGGVRFHVLQPSILIFFVLITLVTSLLAGFYPARVLSSHLAILALKGSGEQRGGEKWLLRKGLIVFQFSVSLVFIISGIVIADQLKYTRQKDFGFNADAIITVGTPWDDSLSKISVLAQKIKQVPGVNKVALQWVPPMTGNGRGHSIKLTRADVKETGVVQVAGNEDFIPLYGIKLLAGRNLLHADSLKEFVINENLSKLMGCKIPEDAIGKMLYWDDKPFPVVGVVSDFHSRSFHESISPLCLVNRPDRERILAIKLSSTGMLPGMVKTTLAQIQQLWKQVYPSGTFDFQFYDESLALLYEKDLQTATLVNAAIAVTVFISCLGLFGLALFTAEKRAREISIRKILGAGFTDIVIMLSKDFAILVIIALLIASPIAWYFMNQWLQGFAYHIKISWWVFMVSGVAGIFIALLTVGFQAIKAAVANPVKSLRTE